ncbi:hypothetical protein J2S70_001437 [Trueperella bonasi]|uniref:Uncharacterized protein n=1 Tax=Trueperella bonasi TaxID=312286 RepID=A0ABT9NHH3_9ACTO|nr:hypothetical protein [Trueperella bonasi]
MKVSVYDATLTAFGATADAQSRTRLYGFLRAGETPVTA